MNAIEYLSQIKKLNVLIETKSEEILRLYEMATSITVALKEDVVQSSGNHDRMAIAIETIVDLKNELEIDVQNYVNIRKDVLSTISKLDANEYKVLYAHYFLDKSFANIAYEMNYSRENIRLLHNKALKNVEKLIEN